MVPDDLPMLEDPTGLTDLLTNASLLYRRDQDGYIVYGVGADQWDNNGAWARCLPTAWAGGSRPRTLPIGGSVFACGRPLRRPDRSRRDRRPHGTVASPVGYML